MFSLWAKKNKSNHNKGLKKSILSLNKITPKSPRRHNRRRPYVGEQKFWLEGWLNFRALNCNLYVETFPKLSTLEDLGVISLMEQASFHKRPTCNISMATWSKHDFLLFVCIKDRQLQCKPQRVKKKGEGGRERRRGDRE